MNLTLLKSKIHRAVVTGADLNYEGSISIGPELMDAAQLLEFERVDVYNCDNGQRFSTYVIKGEAREICLNGAAARLVHEGDRVIIACYATFDAQKAASYQPKIVLVDENNHIKSKK